MDYIELIVEMNLTFLLVKNKVNTYNDSNLRIVSNYLTTNNIKILNVDFEEAVKDAQKGDFIYFDPPYDSDTTIFSSYTENGLEKMNK